MPANGIATSMFCRVRACSSGLMWQSAGIPMNGHPVMGPSALMVIPVWAIPKAPTKRKAATLASTACFATLIASQYIARRIKSMRVFFKQFSLKVFVR